MNKAFIYPAEMRTQSTGSLQVNTVSTIGYTPLENADITIYEKGVESKVIDKLTTNNLGQSPELELPAPPLEYSLEPTGEQPYSEYTIEISVPDYEIVTITGTQILPTRTALQEVTLSPIKKETISSQQITKPIIILPHTLYFSYPPKIPEAEIKPRYESGEIVLSEVVIPEFVVVHDGPPDDPKSRNYYIRYKDYIKNVASSEIYATWPESTIQANVLAILSFTLNRVFTEWYRAKGKNFTITSSTAYDHMFVYGRNIYKNISQIVDILFINYLSRPNVVQPILTQYCDGIQVQCPNWMTQWGSKYLGDQGKNAIEIIRHFYGSNMYIDTAKKVSGIPSSWPGSNLTLGVQSEAVRTIQKQLNAISNKYPAIPKIRVDGVYGDKTENSVKIFQKVFNLPQTGIVDYPTWYKISDIFVAVTRMAELV